MRDAAQAAIDAYDEALKHRPMMWDDTADADHFAEQQKLGAELIESFRRSMEALRVELTREGS